MSATDRIRRLELDPFVERDRTPDHVTETLAWPFEGQRVVRFQETTCGQTYLERAELPGVEADRDLSVEVADGVLQITVQPRWQPGTGAATFRWGSFRRCLALPPGACAKDVRASCAEGVLEVRIHVPPRSRRRITVEHGSGMHCSAGAPAPHARPPS